MTTCPRCGRPRLLDAFSGQGGAGYGYWLAGFCVTGVDLDPQPRYPFEFVQADAMEVLRDADFLADFAAIHASPPCQHYANVTKWRGNADDHPDLVGPVRDHLETWGGPYVIENVPGAPVRADLTLCGSQFGLRVQRHRLFEVSGLAVTPPDAPCRHVDLLPFMHKGERAYADAMGCHWMTNRGGRQAIPPAYTEHIGRQLVDHLQERAA